MNQIKITNRDVELLFWINTIGFVTIAHVAAKLSVSKKVAYRRLRKLILGDYLLHRHVFHGEPGVYHLTHLGVKLSNSPIPPLKKISLATYHHDVLVTTLLLRLAERAGTEIIPERLIRYDGGNNPFGRKGHTPDGVLIVNGKHIAFELELTRKSKHRLVKIFNHYLKTLTYSEVWYFCGSSEVSRLIEPFTKKLPFLKLIDVDDYLENHQHQLLARG